MSAHIDKIKEISKRLLADCSVDMVIGFKKGSMPMKNEPLAAKTADDVDVMVWDSNCRINLANYLTNRKEKIGIVAKGCDSRNIVNHIVENKIKRDQLYIIGVPCEGMVDRRLIEKSVPGEILEMEEADGKITVKGADFEKPFEKADVLRQNCAVCIHKNPVIYDELASDLVEEQTDVDRYEDIRRIESMSSEEKREFFEDLLSSCIRCYACRNACPLCYCPTCFVDESRPQWVGKGNDAIDIQTFHFLRAYHCAGRCTDCGACEEACPVGINMRLLTRKLEQDCKELYNWEAGLNQDERPPLDTYKADDPEIFIK
ncbi:MAG: 4Fe-4S dicluster domain-containing protein [Desulfobacterales bacterium]